VAEKREKEIEDALASFKEVETAGYRVQERGRSLVQQAQRGKQTLEFLKTEMPKYEKVAEESPEIAAALSQSRYWLKLAKHHAQESVARLRDPGSSPIFSVKEGRHRFSSLKRWLPELCPPSSVGFDRAA
jgi:hypothetical protein